MWLTPQPGPAPQASERGRSVPSGSRPPAVPLIAYGTDGGRAAVSAPEVPLPPSLAAIILEVAPVQTQPLTQTENSTDGTTGQEAEAGLLVAVPPGSGGG